MDILQKKRKVTVKDITLETRGFVHLRSGYRVLVIITCAVSRKLTLNWNDKVVRGTVNCFPNLKGLMDMCQ